MIKIRMGFVSNSSSSSFLIALPKEPKDTAELKEMLGYGTVPEEWLQCILHKIKMGGDGFYEERRKLTREELLAEWLENSSDTKFYHELLGKLRGPKQRKISKTNYALAAAVADAIYERIIKDFDEDTKDMFLCALRFGYQGDGSPAVEGEIEKSVVLGGIKRLTTKLNPPGGNHG
jgi:hypothetical protein